MGELRLRQWRSLLSLSRLNEDPRAKEERRAQYGTFGVLRLFRLRHQELGATDGTMHLDATGLLPKPQTALRNEEIAGLQFFFAGTRPWSFNTSKLLPLSLSFNFSNFKMEKNRDLSMCISTCSLLFSIKDILAYYFCNSFHSYVLRNHLPISYLSSSLVLAVSGIFFNKGRTETELDNW
jgi:hypothetical protein|uniref:Uncharacterized protein n=1 Tax=Bionectria ochroleuca TaxID=29856 RepID=A0A8H7NCN6_BIOOC